MGHRYRKYPNRIFNNQSENEYDSVVQWNLLHSDGFARFAPNRRGDGAVATLADALLKDVVV